MKKQKNLARKSLEILGKSFLVMGLIVTTSLAANSYTVEGDNPDGNQIISEMVMVPTLEAEPSTGGADIEIAKYGVVTLDGQMLIPPMMEHTQGAFGPFTLTFEENGFSQQVYDADYYYYGGMGAGWQPDGCKNLLVNKDYTLWKGYDQFYDQFITDNRFVIKDDNVYNLIDRDMEIIAIGYSNIIELDDGKWYTSDDPSKSDQYYNVVRTNDGAVYHGFDPASKDVVSPWAKPYLAQAKENGIVQDTTYATQNVTRNEFCRLAASTLEAMDFVPPENLKAVSYSDTQDKNVLYLSQLGVINGVGNGKFDPYADITREEAAKILVNLANLVKLDTTAKSPATRFRDSNLVSSWATDYVLTISALQTENGEAIMGGTSATTFDPQGPYTLEQAITTLVRLSGTTTSDAVNLGLTYSYMGKFYDGLAVVQNYQGKYGYINTNGQVVVPVIYDNIVSMIDGIGCVGKDGKRFLVDAQGNVTPDTTDYSRLPGEFPYFKESGYALVEEFSADGGRTVYFVNRQGKIVSDRYDNAREFQNGFAAVEIDSKWGFLDTNFDLVVPAEYGFVEYHDTIGYGYSAAGFDKNGIVMLEKDGKWGYVDKTGKALTEFIYTNVRQFSDGLARVSTDDTSRMAAKNPAFGYINLKGDMVIAPTDLGLWPGNFSEGMAKLGDRTYEGGYIDKTGKQVLDVSTYYSAGDFHDGLALVHVYSNVVRFINDQGEFLGDTVYEDGTDFDGGFAHVKKDGKWGLLDTNGNLVIPCIYSTAEHILKVDDGLYLVKDPNGWMLQKKEV